MCEAVMPGDIFQNPCANGKQNLFFLHTIFVPIRFFFRFLIIWKMIICDRYESAIKIQICLEIIQK